MKTKPTDYLFGLELHGIKLGLDNITQLLACESDPHLAYPTVHVAGTNGKGSVTAFLDAMFRAAGYRVGRFTSPHLVSVRERFLINGQPITDEALEDEIVRMRAAADASGMTPTFFEANTAIAFRHFRDAAVDVAIIEVGLGGRFDSTNVVKPIATAITNIGLEHTAYLGDTLAKIAFEKAGIIKHSTPVVVAERAKEPLGVILARAQALGAPVTLADRDYQIETGGEVWKPRANYKGKAIALDDLEVALPGKHQVQNAGVALALAEELNADFPRLNESAMRTGLAEAKWPARLERHGSDPVVILDVAHNEAGARVLADALDEPCVMVLAVASDKSAKGILDVLGLRATATILTQFSNRRALPVDELSRAAGEWPHEAIADLHAAVHRGIQLAREHNAPLVIAGSLFLAGEVRPILETEQNWPPLEF